MRTFRGYIRLRDVNSFWRTIAITDKPDGEYSLPVLVCELPADPMTREEAIAWCEKHSVHIEDDLLRVAAALMEGEL